jgi:hypothetical protein
MYESEEWMLHEEQWLTNAMHLHSTLLYAIPYFSFSVCIPFHSLGDFLPDYAINLLSSGNINGEYLLTGSAGNEYGFWANIQALIYNTTAATVAGVQAQVATYSSNNTQSVNYFAANGTAAQLYTQPSNDPLTEGFQLAEALNTGKSSLSSTVKSHVTCIRQICIYLCLCLCGYVAGCICVEAGEALT